MKFESQLQIVTAAGVPPFTVNQTALVINLNADLLDGQHGSYYAAASSLGNYLPLTGGTLTGTLTGTIGIFTTVRTTELTSLLGSNGPITITPDGTGHVHINSTDIRLGPNNTNATLATRGTGDLILRTNEGSAVEGFIRIFDGANGNIEITPNGTGTVVVGKLSGSTASFSGQVTSTVATGTAPLVIASTTAVTNLNSDLLDGQHGSYFEGRDTTAIGFSGGSLTLTRTAGNLSVSLDGRYLPLTGGTLTGALTGTSLTLSSLATLVNSAGSNYNENVRLPRATSGYVSMALACDTSGSGSIAGQFNIIVYPSTVSQGAFAIRANGTDALTMTTGGAVNIPTLSGTSATFSGVVSGASFTGAGTGLTGTAASLNIGGNAATATSAALLGTNTGTNPSSLQYWQLTGNSTLNPNTSYWYALRMGHGDADTYYSATIAVDFFNDDIQFRRKTNGTNQSWRSLLHAGNFSSYALPLTGGTITGQLSVNGTTASDILRLYTTGSTVWKLGVTDASGSYFNITADFGNVTIYKLNGNVTTPGSFVSTVATGTAPLSVTSTTVVGNLNSDLLDGQHGSYFENRDTTAVGFSGGTLTLTRATGNLTVGLDGRYLPLTGGVLTGALTGTTAAFGGDVALNARVSFGNRQPVYSLFHGGAQDLAWKKIADITFGTALYSAATFKVEVIDANTNFGSMADCKPMTFFVSCRRSGGVLNDADNALVFGPVADYVRAVKTATGVYELQIRQIADWLNHIFIVEIISQGAGTVTYVTGTPANGSTTGTIYLPTTGGYTQRFTNLAVTGATTLSGTLSVTGAATLSSTLAVTGSSRLGGGTSNPAGTAFSNTIAGVGGSNRVVNFDGVGSLPSVWWTNGATAIGAIDAVSGGGLSFWSNNGSAWQQQVSMTYGAFNVLTTLQQGGNQVLHAGNVSTYALPIGGGTLTGNVTAPRFISNVATGTAPFGVTSTTVVTNLNADLLDGQEGSFYQNAGNLNAGTLPTARLPAFTGGDVTSTAGSTALTLGNSGVTAGTYRSVTVDGKGRVTAGTNPTTLAGYGITDAMKIGGQPGVDLNTLTAAGVYRIGDAETNRPDNYGQLLVMYGGGDTITQIYGHYVDGTLKTRSGNPSNVGGGGSWSAWRTLLGNHNFSSYALPISGGTITGSLTITGTLTEGGYLAFPERVYTVDLTAQSAANFYPIVINGSPGNDPWHHRFSLEMPSLGGGAAYNMDHVHGEARGQGWSDQTLFYRVFHNCYDNAERSLLGIWNSTQNWFGIVLYVRGGQTYSVRTTSRSVTGYTSAVTLNNSTFAIKNATGADVSGASVAIAEIFNLINTPQGFHSSYNNYIGGTQVVTNTGTWGISITGTATTATTANGLNAANNYQVNSIGVGIAASGTAGSIGLNQAGTRSWSITPSGGNLNFASGDGNGAANFSVALQQGGQQVLHAGNYTNYAIRSQAGLSVDITSTNLNQFTTTGFWRGTTMTGAPDAGWWYVVVESHDLLGTSGWVKQTATAYGAANSYTAGTTFIRVRQGGSTWSAWVRELDSANFNSFALPLTGGTLTGALSGTSASFSSTLTVTGAVTSGYGSFGTPGLIVGDAQYGLYTSSGNLFYKSASTGNHVWRNIANSANTMTLDNGGNLAAAGAITTGGNQVVHAGNVSAYTIPYLSAVAEASLDMATGTGLRLVNKTGYSSTLLTLNVSGSTGPFQLDANYTGVLRWRNQTDSTTWTAWKTLLHDGNYGGYSTFSGTVTGSSFSGQGTGLTGTAASLTAGSANAIADGAVSTTAKLANSVVTYAKIQNVAVSTVLGNSSASVAQAPQALSMATLAGMLSGQTMNIVGSSTSCTGNSATATNLSADRTNWSTNGVISAVVGQLAWKHYGNNHTIFDASNSTAPNGSAINNTNAQVAWTGTYPTLMGWNGANTYGVRVDSARVADSAASATSATSATTATNSTQLNGQAASYYENRDTTSVSISAGTLTLGRGAGNLTATIGGRVVAWCDFNGNFASSQSPNASFNVSSITKNATGDYTVNFSSSLGTANYVVAGTAQLDTPSPGQSNYNVMVAVPRRSGAKAAGSCRVVCEYPAGVALYDSISVGVAFIAA